MDGGEVRLVAAALAVVSLIACEAPPATNAAPSTTVAGPLNTSAEASPAVAARSTIDKAKIRMIII